MRAQLKRLYGDTLVVKYNGMLFDPFPDRFAELLTQLDIETASFQGVEMPARKNSPESG